MNEEIILSKLRKDLQNFMAWFNTDFPEWQKNYYKAEYTDNNTRISITKMDDSSFIISSPINAIVAKVNEFNLRITFQAKDNKPIIEVYN